MSSDLELLTPKTKVLEQFETQPRAGGQWELNLKIDLTDGPLHGRAVVDFILLGEQFSGTTLLHLELNDIKNAPGVGCDIEGEISAGDVYLSVILDDEELSRSPFQCDGKAIQAGKSYEGSVFVPCIDPVECGCGGSTGEFTLTRIEDTNEAD